MKKQKLVDLRTVKRHPLYQVFNEYFTELFEAHPDLDHKIIDVMELSSDLEARFGKLLNINQVASALDAYGEELPNGHYQIKRADFYLPKTV